MPAKAGIHVFSWPAHLPKPVRQMPDITVTTVTGQAIAPFLPALAALRIKIFRDFPYLYDGDPAYEQTYLQTYLQAPRAAIILARSGETIIGASTCLPLADETPNIQKPFVEASADLTSIFYFGESVLDHAYRGRGIGVRFFEAREAHAKSFGHDYDLTTFCAVNRPPDHPLRPPGYTPLDSFWTARGYTRRGDLTCKLSWRDLNESSETEKTLTFWTRSL
jgi:GNAT superfamily N-acetyltransferase